MSSFIRRSATPSRTIGKAHKRLPEGLIGRFALTVSRNYELPLNAKDDLTGHFPNDAAFAILETSVEVSKYQIE
jgi:hypothetical protein